MATGKCDCGLVAKERKHGEWICERCAKIESTYALHVNAVLNTPKNRASIRRSHEELAFHLSPKLAKRVSIINQLNLD